MAELAEHLLSIRARLYAHGDSDLASALGDEVAWARLSERRKADLDAVLVGQGYLCGGERVDPRQITTVRPDPKYDA